MSSIHIPIPNISEGTARMRHPESSHGILYVLMALALVRALLYSVLSPPFDGPDEKAHFEYVAYLATGGRSGPIGPEGHQPVGYYALMVPAYLLAAGQTPAIQLFAVRVASVSFLLGTVLFTWLAARKMSSGNILMPIVATGFVALHPALAYFAGSANNDNAANLMGAILAYLVVSLLSAESQRWTMPAAAMTIGAAVLTKGQVLPMVAIAAAVLAVQLVAASRSLHRGKLLLFLGMPVFLAAALLAGNSGDRMLNVSTSSISMLFDWPAMWKMIQESSPSEPFSVMFITFWNAYLAGAIYPSAMWHYAPVAAILLAGIGYALGLPVRRIKPCRSAIVLRVVLLGMILSVGLVVYLRFLYTYQDPYYEWKMMVIQGHFLHVTIAPLALLVGDGWGLLTPTRVRGLASWGVLALLAVFDAASFATLFGHYTWR